MNSNNSVVSKSIDEIDGQELAYAVGKNVMGWDENSLQFNKYWWEPQTNMDQTLMVLTKIQLQGYGVTITRDNLIGNGCTYDNWKITLSAMGTNRPPHLVDCLRGDNLSLMICRIALKLVTDIAEKSRR